LGGRRPEPILRSAQDDTALSAFSALSALSAG
jgi:hypothetical protein